MQIARRACSEVSQSALGQIRDTESRASGQTAPECRIARIEAVETLAVQVTQRQSAQSGANQGETAEVRDPDQSRGRADRLPVHECSRASQSNECHVRKSPMSREKSRGASRQSDASGVCRSQNQYPRQSKCRATDVCQKQVMSSTISQTEAVEEPRESRGDTRIQSQTSPVLHLSPRRIAASRVKTGSSYSAQSINP
uniref:Uncharacterized protein n=1 Tax=Knipowitschia caucasica TaxID=637954 RepID=A0AAV2KR17_KNICA